MYMNNNLYEFSQALSYGYQGQKRPLTTRVLVGISGELCGSAINVLIAKKKEAGIIYTLMDTWHQPFSYQVLLSAVKKTAEEVSRRITKYYRENEDEFPSRKWSKETHFNLIYDGEDSYLDNEICSLNYQLCDYLNGYGKGSVIFWPTRKQTDFKESLKHTLSVINEGRLQSDSYLDATVLSNWKRELEQINLDQEVLQVSPILKSLVYAIGETENSKYTNAIVF